MNVLDPDRYRIGCTSKDVLLKHNGVDSEYVAFAARKDELFLDFDGTNAPPPKFYQNLDILQRLTGYGFPSVLFTTSKSGSGIHAYLKLGEDIDEPTRVMWQAFLGSDPTRELLAWARVQNGDETPSVLIETKAGAAAVEMWRTA